MSGATHDDTDMTPEEFEHRMANAIMVAGYTVRPAGQPSTGSTATTHVQDVRLAGNQLIRESRELVGR